MTRAGRLDKESLRASTELSRGPHGEAFTLVVAHTRDGHSVDEIAFLMQLSPSLVHAYQELYERYNTPEHQERIEEIIATVKARGFRPSQLEDENEPAEGKKGGTGR